jgi:hypothetical protein
MTSPSETAADHQLAPEYDQIIPEGSAADPATATVTDIPHPASSAALDYRTAPAVNGATEEPAATGETAATDETELEIPQPPHRAHRPGQSGTRLLPLMTQVPVCAGTRSRRRSSMIRAHALSWQRVSWTTASGRSYCPSGNGSTRRCPAGSSVMRGPRNCASRSSNTARSGIVSKISPVRFEYSAIGRSLTEEV